MNCPRCNRPTPSGRAVCMYCGEAPPVTKIEAAPRQRHLEYSERAFNTVIDPARSRTDDQSETSLAGALQLEPAEARAFIVTQKRVPIARSQTRQEAELIAALMRTCGLGASVVADDDLQLDKDLIRARRITRNQEHLEIHHSNGDVSVTVAEIRLMVVGALHNTRIDFTEGIARTRNSGGLLDTSEFRSGEMVADDAGGRM